MSRRWRARAVCLEADTKLFFGAEGRGADQSSHTEEALRWCLVCPVRAECGSEALDRRETYGVWGGMTPETRRSLVRKHGARAARVRFPEFWRAQDEAAEAEAARVAEEQEQRRRRRELAVRA